MADHLPESMVVDKLEVKVKPVQKTIHKAVVKKEGTLEKPVETVAKDISEKSDSKVQHNISDGKNNRISTGDKPVSQKKTKTSAVSAY